MQYKEFASNIMLAHYNIVSHTLKIYLDVNSIAPCWRSTQNDNITFIFRLTDNKLEGLYIRDLTKISSWEDLKKQILELNNKVKLFDLNAIIEFAKTC